VLVKGYSWYATLMLVFPCRFWRSEAAGLIFLISNWGKSTERRAVQSQQAASAIRSMNPDGRHGPIFRACPTAVVVDQQSGARRWAYRLPVARATWSLLARSCAICLLFNGIVGVFRGRLFVRGNHARTPEMVFR